MQNMEALFYPFSPQQPKAITLTWPPSWAFSITATPCDVRLLLASTHASVLPSNEVPSIFEKVQRHGL